MTAMTTSTARTATRADVQRDRILNAALKCFIESGFHAASMASIAEAAQMSVGLMYRYFANKNAIVQAIVERQLEEKRAVIRQLQSTDQLVPGLISNFQQWRAPEPGTMSVALLLEMSAEATRNPQIAEALRASDALTRAEFEEWLCRSREAGGAGLPPEVAAARALSIRLVVDGLALRAAREPDLDLAELSTVLDDLIRRLLA